MANAKTRASETREAEERPQEWKPSSLLPVPEPEPGYSFKWVRTSTLDKPDTKNVSAKLREGWVPVLASDYRELQVTSDIDSRFKDNLEVGGLILCKCPANIMQQRREYQQRQSDGQMQAVDNNFLRQSDPRMPVLAPERKTRISNFGDE